MNFEKLKEAARKYEQKEDWRRAIEVYLQAIQEFESGHDPAPDLSIYNRVGDLYLKANEPGAAVQAYERAADLYRDQGFLNNAIALCGKILRVNPGRIQTYLKLAHLHARKNVVIEAKKNLLEYLERMNALGQLDDAFKSVKDFADQFPGNKEIRLMLSELLRASSRNEEAKEQLEKLASDLEARGDTIGARKTLARLQSLDFAELPPGSAPKPKRSDLIFLDTGSSVPAGAQRQSPAGKPRQTLKHTPPPVELPVASEPETLLIQSSAVDFSDVVANPLTIETSSLLDAPLTLDPVDPISDEAQLESSSLDVGKTLGFESTIVEFDAAPAVSPLDGLEIDEPLTDTVLDITPLSDEREAEIDLYVERAPDEIVELEDLDRPDFSLAGPGLVELEPEAADDTAGAAADEGVELSDDLALGLDTMPSMQGAGGGDGGLNLDVMDTGEATAIDPRPSAGLSFLQADEPIQPTISELEERVFDDPDNPETHRGLGEALIAAGDKSRGAEELDLALASYENREDWQHAFDLVQELIRLDPNNVRHHQKRVEIGFRSGDRSRLIDAYLELADALVRAGALDKALAVYRRVAEHDPGNGRALAALDSMAPEEPAQPAAPPPARQSRGAGRKSKRVEPPEPTGTPVFRASEASTSSDFIDLAALVQEEARAMDTRMKVEDEEPTGDEQRDFDDMLQQFKRGIDQNIDAEDFRTHYDLGVAFKEMGLLDEAIAEFQKALRAPEVRLRTSEALGGAFYEKGQYAIAESILKRAVESLGATDDEQIGLLYWLGRAAEAQGKIEAAVPWYQRVLAVDIHFQDVATRMSKLSAGQAG